VIGEATDGWQARRAARLLGPDIVVAKIRLAARLAEVTGIAGECSS
jgi:hypothetical protein